MTTGRILAGQHVVPALGARKLRDLSAEDADRRLADKAETLSTPTLGDLKSILRQPLREPQHAIRSKRNVVLVCETPPDKSADRRRP